MPKNILVADDDPSILRLYSRIFSGTDYAITYAETVAAASSLIDANDYDLLITDLMFPDGLGTELTRHFSKKTRKAKSLLVTGSMLEAGPIDTAHVEDCLGKPIDLDLFLNAVSKALS